MGFKLEYPGHHYIRNADVKRHGETTDHGFYKARADTMYESLFFALKACFEESGVHPPLDIITDRDPDKIKAYVQAVNAKLTGEAHYLFNGEKP